MTKELNVLLFRIVQLATVLLFLGRAYQHIFWDAPYRALLWDEYWMKGIVEGIFNTSWDQFITSPETDQKIQNMIRLNGWFYLGCAVSALIIDRFQRFAKVLLIAGSISLIFLAGLYTKEKFFHLGQFFEYSLQFTTPLILVYLAKFRAFDEKLILFLKITIGLTFVCHGLYAVNYYPRPGNFMEMTMTILGIGDNAANQVLLAAGILDFVVAVVIFLPFKYARFALLYIIIWGFGTTIARIWSNVYLEFFWESLHQWWFESAFRSPHFLIPLVLFLYYTFKKRETE